MLNNPLQVMHFAFFPCQGGEEMVAPFVVDYITEMKAEGRIFGGFLLFPIHS